MPIQKLSPNFEAPLGVEANNYQYNGIELVEDFGLHINHAQFRSLDPQTGRWWQVDPMAEKFYAWSPYNSNFGNPVRFEDNKGDTPVPGGGDKQPTNRNDIDGGGGGGGLAIGWGMIALGKAMLEGFGIGVAADATVQVAGEMITEGRSFPDAVANVDGISCVISGGFSAFGVGVGYNLGIIGVTNAEGLISGTIATAGLGFLESVSKQVSDGKRGPIDATQVAKDVVADVIVGIPTIKAETKISSNGGKIALQVASEVSSNTAQNMLQSKPTQKSSNSYHNQGSSALQEKALR